MYKKYYMNSLMMVLLSPLNNMLARGGFFIMTSLGTFPYICSWCGHYGHCGHYVIQGDQQHHHKAVHIWLVACLYRLETSFYRYLQYMCTICTLKNWFANQKSLFELLDNGVHEPLSCPGDQRRVHHDHLQGNVVDLDGFKVFEM